MNLIQVEREIRKMTDCLSRPQMEPEEAKLAQQYAELCALANQRLLQCASMINAGDTHQALQLAEVRPPLLDLITLLAFKQADEWRTRCRTNHLPLAEPLDSKSIKALNAAYNKGIATNDPMYKEYREAMMKNDDARAIAVLRMIVRLNPSDTNAAQELKQLEQKDMAARLRRLGEFIQAGDNQAVFEQVHEIESFANSLTKHDDVWRRAHGIRCRVMFHELQDLRGRESWPDCLALLSQIRELCVEFSIELNEASSREMTEIDHWARQQARNQVDEENFNRITSELALLLDTDRLGSPSKLGKEELTREMEILTNKRRELDQFAREIPADLGNQLNHVLQALRTSIHRLEARKTMTTRISLGVAAAVVIIAALIVFQWRRETGLAVTLKKMADGNQLAAMEKVLATASNQHAFTPQFVAARQAAEAYLKQNHDAIGQCAQGVAQLNAYSAGDFATADLEQVYRRHADLMKAIKSLPVDAQADPHLNLSAFNSRWDSFLSQEGPRRSAKFAELLGDARNRAQSAANASFADAASEDEQKIAALESSLESLIGTSIPELQIDRAVTDKYHTFREEWESWRSITKTLRAPGSLATYLNALRQLQDCKLFNAKSATAATTIASLDMTPWHLKSALIMNGGDLMKWTNHAAAVKSSLYPSDVRPGESSHYRELRDDEQIKALLHERDVVNYEPVTLGKEVYVYAVGPINVTSNQQVGRIYDPVADPDSLAYKNTSNYTNKIHLKEEGHHPPEYYAFTRIGPESFFDQQTGTFKAALLEVLDHLNQETNCSPLFRAYVAMKLYSIIDVRPLEWGYVWCPAASADRKRLVELGAQRITSGSWYVPRIIHSDTERFEKYFESARSTSYMKQALFYQALTKRLDAADFSFVGYFHPERGLMTTSTSGGGNRLWGFGTNGKLIMLYQLNPQTSKYDLVQKPLPFSPVFGLAQDYHLDVEQACQAAGLEKIAPSIADCPLIAE